MARSATEFHNILLENDIVSIYDKAELFRVLTWSEDRRMYRIQGVQTGKVYTVSYKTIIKYIKYHNVWKDLCLE